MSSPDIRHQEVSQAFLEDNFLRLTAVPQDIVDTRLAATAINPETGVFIARDVVPQYDVSGVSYGIHAALVPDQKVVNIHVHDPKNPAEQGGDLETYLVLEAGENGESGIMSTGVEWGDPADKTLGMNPDITVTKGTQITINPGTAHELHGPAKILFSCPDSHINQENRRFLSEYVRVPLGVTEPVGVTVVNPA